MTMNDAIQILSKICKPWIMSSFGASIYWAGQIMEPAAGKLVQVRRGRKAVGTKTIINAIRYTKYGDQLELIIEGVPTWIAAKNCGVIPWQVDQSRWIQRAIEEIK